MKRIVILAVILLPVAALAQQGIDPVQAAILLSLDLQKKAVQAQDMANLLATARSGLEKAVAETAYWRDACQSTPDCGGESR